MTITNKSKKKSIVTKTTYCKTFFRKLRGLMFAKPIVDEGLVFVYEKETFIHLHMLFVFFPIDILWLDSNKQVVGIKRSAKPFCWFIEAPAPAQYVVELPKDTINRSSTVVGDEIALD